MFSFQSLQRIQMDNIQQKNVDQKDVDHFSSYAEDWWDVNGTWSTLHEYNHVRIPFIVNSLEKRNLVKNGSLSGLKIIDVGCGAGIVSEALAKKDGEVVGLDPSEELIKSAVNHLSSQSKLNLKYLCGLIEDHAENFPNHYDVVVTSEVLEHVIDKKSFLRGCIEVLKPGGSIIITTINKTVSSWFHMKLIGEYLFRILPLGTHSYDQFISPKDLKAMLKEFHSEAEDETGFYYWFLNKKFYLSQNMNCSFGLHAIKADKIN